MTMLLWVSELGVVQSLEKHHQAQLAQQAQREEEDRLQQVTTLQVSYSAGTVQ